MSVITKTDVDPIIKIAWSRTYNSDWLWYINAIAISPDGNHAVAVGTSNVSFNRGGSTHLIFRIWTRNGSLETPVANRVVIGV